MGIELGILYDNQKPPTPWLRWWDNKGNLLLTGNELAEQAEVIAIRERLAKEQAETIASQERLAREQAETIAYQERLAKERAETIAYQERLAKEQERQQKEKLAAYLRSLGIDPEKI
jgi:thioredoxin-related protein